MLNSKTHPFVLPHERGKKRNSRLYQTLKLLSTVRFFDVFICENRDVCTKIGLILAKIPSLR